jgi:hypothetical protein
MKNIGKQKRWRERESRNAQGRLRGRLVTLSAPPTEAVGTTPTAPHAFDEIPLVRKTLASPTSECDSLAGCVLCSSLTPLGVLRFKSTRLVL